MQPGASTDYPVSLYSEGSREWQGEAEEPPLPSYPSTLYDTSEAPTAAPRTFTPAEAVRAFVESGEAPAVEALLQAVDEGRLSDVLPLVTPVPVITALTDAAYDVSTPLKEPCRRLVRVVEGAEGFIAIPSCRGVTEVTIPDIRPGVAPSKVVANRGDMMCHVHGGQPCALRRVEFNGIDTLRLSGIDIILEPDTIGYTIGALRAIAAACGVSCPDLPPHKLVVKPGTVYWTERNERVAQFRAITQLDEETARQRLRSNNYNVDYALNFHFNYGGHIEANEGHPFNQGAVPAPPRPAPPRFHQRAPVPHHAPRRYQPRPHVPTPMPKHRDLFIAVAHRLLSEYRSVGEQTLPCVKAVVPEQGDLSSWKVELVFPSDSTLQRSLEDYARSIEKPSAAKLTMGITFPLDFPGLPPEVRVISPRLKYLSAPVSFSGKLSLDILSSKAWEADNSVADVLQACVEKLEGAEVAMRSACIRGYTHEDESGLPHLASCEWPTENTFDKEFTVLSSSRTGSLFGVSCDVDASDRIVLPMETADEIYGAGDDVVLPLMFEITSPCGRKRHCGISVEGFNRQLPSGHAILPTWVLDDIFVNEYEKVRIRCVDLKPIRFVKLQPHSASFYLDAALCEDTALALQMGLRGMSALTENTSVPITLHTRDGPKRHLFEVMTLQPNGAVRLIEEDPDREIKFRVEFERAPDHEDEEEKRARLSEQAERLRARVAKEKEKEERQAMKREKRAAARYQQAFECLSRMVDELRWGEEGEIEVCFRFEDGETCRASFPPYDDITPLLSFLTVRAKWVRDQQLLSHQITITTAFPRRPLTADQPLNASLHKQVLSVARKQEADMPRLESCQSFPFEQSHSMDDMSREPSGDSLLTDGVVHTQVMLCARYVACAENLSREDALLKAEQLVGAGCTPVGRTAVIRHARTRFTKRTGKGLADPVVIPVGEVVSLLNEDMQWSQVIWKGCEGYVPRGALVLPTEELVDLVNSTLSAPLHHGGHGTVSEATRKLLVSKAPASSRPLYQTSPMMAGHVDPAAELDDSSDLGLFSDSSNDRPPDLLRESSDTVEQGYHPSPFNHEPEDRAEPDYLSDERSRSPSSPSSSPPPAQQSDHEAKAQQLVELFPSLDRDSAAAILECTDGNIEEAVLIASTQ
eukprot:Sspe_Gene.61921::Locus_34514_Transcript_1_1_Confidence_1.000_Length_3772::g.61921::m.61921